MMRKKPGTIVMDMPVWEDASSGFSGQGMTMDDIFSSFGDIFGDAFGGFGGFGGGRRGGRRVNKGSNLRVKVKLTLQEIAAGAEKKIKVNKYDNATHAEEQELQIHQVCPIAPPVMVQDMLQDSPTLCSVRCRLHLFALHAVEKARLLQKNALPAMERVLFRKKRSLK